MRAFADPLALSAQDRIGNGEQRRQTLATVEGYLLLLVFHMWRADPKERRRHEQQNR